MGIENDKVAFKDFQYQQVQLREGRTAYTYLLDHDFQYHQVQLRVHFTNNKLDKYLHFQYQQVQLRGNNLVLEYPHDHTFQYQQVQLRARWGYLRVG